MKGVLMIAKPDASSGDADDSAKPNNMVLVPKAALLIDAAAPGMGDTVEFEASGKVVAMQGEDYVVEITSANDKPVQDGDADDAEQPEDPGAERQGAMDSYLNGGSDNGN